MTNQNSIKTEWDLTPLLASDDDPKIEEYRKAVTEAVNKFVDKWGERVDYLTDPSILKQALDEREKLERFKGFGDEVYYFGLRMATDSNNPKVKAAYGSAVEFAKSIMVKLQPFWLKVGNIDEKLQAEFLEHPGLSDYRHLLERKFKEAKHRLSEAEERILTLKATVAHDKWEEMTESLLAKAERDFTDSQGKTESVTMETLMSNFSNPDKKIRDHAAELFNDILRQYAEIAEAEMNALLANKKIDDELRGFPRPDSLRHIADDIETEAVDTLIDVVSKNYEISRRYYKLKAKLLQLPVLQYHERNIPFGELNKSFSFDESTKLISDVFSSVDSDFANIFQTFLEEGRVDVYPRKGKRSGAFCTINSIVHPVYVMLNHTDRLTDVSTIAHEFGHAVNHELLRKENGLNYEISLATAEVASNFLQSFVSDRLLQDADDELRLALLLDEVNGAISSIIRQTAFYKFEQELHQSFREKSFLSAEEIGGIFKNHMQAYMGDAVEQSPGSENWWLYVGHFRVFFYVYSYASGELIAKSLQSRVKKEPNFINDVKKFLSVGGSKSPGESFKDIGVDITEAAFWQAGLDEISKQLDEAEALAKKLGKI